MTVPFPGMLHEDWVMAFTGRLIQETVQFGASGLKVELDPRRGALTDCSDGLISECADESFHLAI